MKKKNVSLSKFSLNTEQITTLTNDSAKSIKGGNTVQELVYSILCDLPPIQTHPGSDNLCTHGSCKTLSIGC